MSRTLAQLLAYGFVVLSTAAPSAVAQVSIRSIEPPDGASAVYAYGLSGDGTTVVGYYVLPTLRKAFRWTAGGGMETLWTGEADAVSWDGSVVIGVKEGLSSGSEVYMTSIGFAHGMSPSSRPADISGDGRVVVGAGPAYVCTVTSPSRAFSWRQSELQQFWLSTLHSSWCPGIAAAKAVSMDGSTLVGESTTDAGYWRAFLYRNTIVNLGSLDGTASTANDVNQDGSVVVGSSSAGRNTRAFAWTSSNGMQDLGAAPGTSDSTALAIAAQAMVVVGRSGNRASIWKPGMGMVGLEPFLAAQGLDLAGWELIQAEQVSADGSTILGFGYRNGQGRYWLVRGVLPCNPIDSGDINQNGIADACEADCNGNSIPDSYEILTGLMVDCNLNGVPDTCDLAAGVPDCNGNLVPDSCDIASGDSSDYNANGIPDPCECLADLFVDGHVNGADLGILLNQWGLGKGAVSDINRDGTVNGADLSILLNSWGACP